MTQAVANVGWQADYLGNGNYRWLFTYMKDACTGVADSITAKSDSEMVQKLSERGFIVRRPAPKL